MRVRLLPRARERSQALSDDEPLSIGLLQRGGAVIRGFITARDVLLHPVTILVPFGFRVYARCLVRISIGRGQAMFLECIWGSPPHVDGAPVSE